MPRGRPSTEARTCGQKPGCQKLLARIPALDTLPTAHQQTCLVRKRAFNVLPVVIVKKLAATPKAPRKDIRPTVLPLDQLKVWSNYHAATQQSRKNFGFRSRCDILTDVSLRPRTDALLIQTLPALASNRRATRLRLRLLRRPKNSSRTCGPLSS